MTDSLWRATAQLPEFPALRGSAKTDVLIIGGGIAGLLCAWMLEQAGVAYILVEEKRICRGITGDTTAKITAQHGLIYEKLTEQLGRERAKLYLQANEAAVKEYAKLCAQIPCGWKEQDSYVYALQEETLRRELEALHRLGFSAEFQKELPLPLECAGAVRFKHQGQFHPLQFLGSIAQGLRIHERTAVRELKGCTAITDGGRIRAEKIIVATHFPFLNKHGAYFLKLYQQRSYVLALDQTQALEGMYIGSGKNSLSFRSYDGLLLLGGGGHRTGKQGGNWAELKSFAQARYPGAKALYQWATQDCMTLDGLPYIGRYSSNTPDMYVITGFNKWGMTNAMAGARLLCDLVQGRDNPYAQVYSPQRGIWKPQLFVNGLEAAGNLVRFSQKRCPHMGCALKWNPQEHTWDCPCHGSRFAPDGKKLDNPATGDLKQK